MQSGLSLGDIVVVPWGLDEILGRVVELYGPPGRPQVVVELSPELSSYVVDETTTIALPADAVHRHRTRAGDAA